MRSTMVASSSKTLLFIYNGFKGIRWILRKIFSIMNDKIILLFSIDDVNNISIRDFQVSFIANLSTSFGIKRGDVKYQLIQFAILFRSHFSVTSYFNLRLQRIISYKFFNRIIHQNNPVRGINGSSIPRSVFLGFHCFIKSIHINIKSFFP